MSSTILGTDKWEKVVSELKNLLSEDVYHTWFKELNPLSETENNLILEARLLIVKG